MRVIISIVLPLTFFCIQAQQPDSAIEVRLSLIQQTSSDTDKGLAFGISVINHSDLERYIPYFESTAAYGGIHFYQEEAGQWRQLDIMTHSYFDIPRIGKDGIVVQDHPDVFVYKQDKISRFYERDVNKIRQIQDSLLVAYLEQTHQQDKFRFISTRKPLFLKAGETMSNYRVYAIDYFMNQMKNYKITFNISDAIPEFLSQDTILSKEFAFFLPERILGYHRYFPSYVLSNTIYYSTLSIPENGPNGEKNNQ